MEDQKELLRLKKKRLDKIISSIEKAIINLKGGENMNNDDTNQQDDSLYQPFDMSEINQYHDEAKQRWGNTDAWKQSQERTKHWTKTDYKKYQQDADTFMKQFAQKMKYGVESEEVQNDIEKVYQQLHTFYDPSIEMFRNLGQMYVDDPRFTAYYEKYAKGLAVFMRDAIAIYCDRKQQEVK